MPVGKKWSWWTLRPCESTVTSLMGISHPSPPTVLEFLFSIASHASTLSRYSKRGDRRAFFHLVYRTDYRKIE